MVLQERVRVISVRMKQSSYLSDLPNTNSKDCASNMLISTHLYVK